MVVSFAADCGQRNKEILPATVNLNFGGNYHFCKGVPTPKKSSSEPICLGFLSYLGGLLRKPLFCNVYTFMFQVGYSNLIQKE